MKNAIGIQGGNPHWVGEGFPVRSLFSSRDSAIDPFLLLDYAGPHEFASSTKRRGAGDTRICQASGLPLRDTDKMLDGLEPK